MICDILLATWSMVHLGGEPHMCSSSSDLKLKLVFMLMILVYSDVLRPNANSSLFIRSNLENVPESRVVTFVSELLWRMSGPALTRARYCHYPRSCWDILFSSRIVLHR